MRKTGDCSFWHEPPQSWKTARIAARASGLHCPLLRNFAVRSLEIWVQTAGHEPELLPCLRTRLVLRAKSVVMSGRFGSEIAAADEAIRRKLVRCMVQKNSLGVIAERYRSALNLSKGLVAVVAGDTMPEEAFRYPYMQFQTLLWSSAFEKFVGFSGQLLPRETSRLSTSRYL